MIAVFAYGTLRDPEYQRELFGHELAMQPATLPGWMTVVAEGGYFTIVPAGGETVSGDLLELDDADIALADGWEEVPQYVRSIVDVVTADGAPAEAWVYVRPTESRERAPAGMFSLHDRSAVRVAIRAFRATHYRCHPELVEGQPPAP
jgi:gamma-glutamylcyclotransferase (GGCT)/AIG2-like uncharacterized protein YtfP